MNNVYSQQNNKGLTVYPIRNELNIEPGMSYYGSLTVTNSTDKAMEVSLSAEVFNVINQQYDYAFTAESNVVKWVNFESLGVSLLPNESKEVKYNIGVPLSAEPGGRYISLFATNDIETQDGGISSRQRIASLLYITVAGNISRTGHLLSLNSPWLISGSSSWSAILRNSGTTHFRSRYNVKINGIVSGGQFASASGDALILPGTVRLINDELPMPILPGIYRLEYEIGLGDTPAQNVSRLIIYMPYWSLFFIAIAVLAVIYWIILIKKKSIKYKNHD